MEELENNLFVVNKKLQKSTDLNFIQANTISVEYEDMKNNHIIPVFAKDNEPVISHLDFINAVESIIGRMYFNEVVFAPAIRVSHPIKGRIPSAKDKSANDLEEHEKTIYYERMAFVIEVPSIVKNIGGNDISLTVGGVKSYNLDNLNSRKGADEHFKVFIGFQNKVCCNLCVWTDGFSGSFVVSSLQELIEIIESRFKSYNLEIHLELLQRFEDIYITSNQFATLIGRLKQFQYLSQDEKKDLPEFLLGDTQLNLVTRDYYLDNHFRGNDDGSINLWKLYNLFTGANKQSYIDTFLDRSSKAFEFVNHLSNSVVYKVPTWFLS